MAGECDTVFVGKSEEKKYLIDLGGDGGDTI
jgi:hypothetical protein